MNGEDQPHLDQLCINTIRMLSVDAVEKAQSGHPGLPMGAAALAYVLWTRFLRHNPANPNWPNRDRFILSAGHGSMLLYSLLHLTGYDLPLADIKNFRQWGSRAPGHPEHGLTPGVEATTGPLGQGFANGVGMAMAECFLAARFNRRGHILVDHYTYGFVSDGDLMEGISHEAASLAGHLRLGKLIYVYLNNRVTIEGSTQLAFTEDREERFRAYGWHVQRLEDSYDLEAISAVIEKAREETRRPSLINALAHIGYGSPNKQDLPSAHGEPLGAEEVRLTKQNLGWPLEPEFLIPEEALAHFRRALPEGQRLEEEWQGRLAAYGEAYPELARHWRHIVHRQSPAGWDEDVPVFEPDPKGVATRSASGTVLNAIAPRLPNLIGGSADLAPSTKTRLKGGGTFQPGDYGGRNISFGVREHAMAAALNGMALHRGVIPYGGTFLVFSDYMRPAIRLAAMMGLHVVYVFTHDSIGLGEDGPTHQPIEHLASLRAIPGLTVIRPADANECAEAWRVAVASSDGPVALILSRHKVPTLDRGKCAPAEGLRRGAYVLSDARDGKPDVILIATGSEVSIALEAAERLQREGVAARVVSMPSWELLERQPEDYRRQVLPPEVKARVSIEAGATLGWRRWVGERGRVLGIDHFGASAPYEVLYEKFGLTADHVAQEAIEAFEESRGG